MLTDVLMRQSTAPAVVEAGHGEPFRLQDTHRGGIAAKQESGAWAAGMMSEPPGAESDGEQGQTIGPQSLPAAVRLPTRIERKAAGGEQHSSAKTVHSALFPRALLPRLLAIPIILPAPPGRLISKYTAAGTHGD